MERVVEVENLVKTFGPVTAVDGISFTIEKGSCVGILGPNGAGKTTTIEILEGLQRPTSGKAMLFGKSWDTDHAELRNLIGLQLQETRYQNDITVQETLILFQSFFPRTMDLEKVIALVNLGEKRHAPVMHLSGGQRQRLGLAIALVSNPELLFLDEPTTGLDPQARRHLWDAIEVILKEKKTVLLTTHSMEEAERLCDRVMILDRGKIIADGSPAQLIATLGGHEVIEFSAKPPLTPDAMKGMNGLLEVKEVGKGLRLSVTGLHVAVPALLETIRGQGSELVSLLTRQATLDDVFLNITGRNLREDA